MDIYTCNHSFYRAMVYTMKQYYEVHITFKTPSKEAAEAFTKKKAPTWTFSAIDGDIILGAGIKCYLTKHFNIRTTEDDVLEELNNTAKNIDCMGIDVIRKKIELVVYDERLK